ncbi:penicillin-binding protein 1C [Campylobacter coli]|uniref:penicillin-binding protein 1C n=1 Tax=Campylobacter coli TaxID=195 RepID=UPI000257DD98|nr:penicillin-binding protein 1C [Campylobacter coli]EIA71658.1 penicillin-binding protein 1C [Campylobacter coli 7--1]EAI8829328.1 penicillin-binding protein 1C [Campylobacter coli]EAI9090045.1 penicillin-binding protein 1C [Campylobacter coli]EAI9092019.1 penicillin-binding protein 1C [Campylobacter coli]EAI9110244.1 penicillin-binding protein 1C [Campylobacter coli]
MKNALKIFSFLLLFFLAYVFYVYFSFDKNTLLDDFKSRYSKILYDKNGEILSVFLNDEEQWHIKSTDIPKRLKVAVINYEDRKFYSHFGVDFLALMRAFVNNFNSTQRSGASTISMQTIKLWDKKDRTYFNKFNEIIQSLALENAFSKDEILKLYLSNAPYGGNLIGYEAAILFYFDKNPKDLTWAQAALLAILPNQPGLINLEKNKTKLLDKRNKLLAKLYERKLINKDIYELSLKEPLPNFKPRKNIAPHLALRLLSDDNKEIFSSIDKKIQLKIEKKAKEFSYTLQQKGIQNLAIILADTKTRKVLAYVGSQDFYDMANLGQINGNIAKRSVGSTLKPFLYALSIDEGIIAPDSILLDVPTFFSNFNPQNANKKYYGIISAKEALQRSLNVPFVSLLQDYGYEKFFYKLKAFLNFEDENYKRYGLSLILGTKELSLEDLIKLYLGLANYGELANLSFIRDENLSGVARMFSKDSAYLTLEAMKELQRVGLENYNKEKIISWKTGTSYGRKDAWAMGATPKYTLGVWVGNFSGEANANLYGVSIAGDLLFEILGLLDEVDLEFAPPDDLMTIKLDSISKYRYDEDLNTSYINVLYPKGANILRTSPFLKKVYEYQGRELDSKDIHFKDAKALIKLDFPAYALHFFQQRNFKFSNKKGVKIIYPKDNLKLILAKDLNGMKGLVAKVANLNNEKLFWYLNQKLIYEGDENTQNLNLKEGKYQLFIISQSGEQDTVWFEIK